MNLFNEYFPRLAKSKLFLIYSCIVILLVIILVGFSGNLVSAYQKAEANKEQIATIESFLAKFSEQKKFLDSIEERPVTADELDEIQTELFKQIKRYKLNLVRFNSKDSSGKNSNNFREFSMAVSGDYVSVMEFLNDFHAKNALMTIKYLFLHQSQGKFNADIVYTVYVQ